MVCKGSDVSIGTQPEGENAKASSDRNIGIIRCLSTRESCFTERKVDAIIHTDLSVARDCKGDEHTGSRRFIGEYSSESSGESGDHRECSTLQKEGGTRT